MTTKFFENQAFIEISLEPSTVEDAAMLLRMVKSSKKKKQRMYIVFSNALTANITIEKVAPVHQTNFINND